MNRQRTEILLMMNNDKEIKQRTENLKDMTKVSCMDGTWNYDPYFHGMANGMICALSLIENKEPVFLDAPEIWLGDKKEDEIKKAFDVIKTAMNNDPSYAWSWHCNIAVSQQDVGVSHKVSNEGAALFMQIAFGIDTNKFNKQENDNE